MVNGGLPRAYYDDILDELDRFPDSLSSGTSSEPRTLLLSKPGRAQRYAARMCFRAIQQGAAQQEAAGGPFFWIEAEPEIALPGDLLGMPDIAVWQTRERPPPDKHGRPEITRTPPLLCCKVVTAEAVKAYRTHKIALYARAGVRWFWLIDPALQTVEVFSMVPEQHLSVVVARENDEVPLPPFKIAMACASFWIV